LHHHTVVFPSQLSDTVPSAANQYPDHVVGQNQSVYHPNPAQGNLQPCMNAPQQRIPYTNPEQQSTLTPHHQVFNRRTTQSPQAVFSPQPASNPVFNQPQEVIIGTGTKPELTHNQQHQVLNQSQLSLDHSQPVLQQPKPVSIQHAQIPANQDPNQSTAIHAPVSTQAQTFFSPLANCVPLVTIPVYAGVPINATQQDTNGKQSKTRRNWEPKTSISAQKSTSLKHSKLQEAGGTTIDITPTKSRDRYYVLDDEEADSTGLEEELYFRRTPRGHKTKKTNHSRCSNKDQEAAKNMSYTLNTY
jgi:hypothetical protein